MSKRDMNRKNGRGIDAETPNISRLYIPRASLSSTTSSSKSSSTASRRRHSRELSPPTKNSPMRGEFLSESEPEGIYGPPINHQFDVNTISRVGSKNLSSQPSSSRNKSNNNNQHRQQQQQQKKQYLVHKAPKPSSMHSLSSTSSASSSTNGSNQSNYSANPLLLSVKNLENFNNRNSEIYNQSDFDHRTQMLANIKNILAIDENLAATVTSDKKDVDQLSTTSSVATNTNFTVITFNGFNKERKKSRSICRRRHQVTLVIVVMTIVLFFGISSAVCVLEMRYKKMPR